MQDYHDQEWGVPVHNDKKHYEFLVLDCFQAGLSWKTILHRRKAFRKAFANFDPKKVACFGDADVERLLQDEGIIRNRLKITSSINNARALIAVQKEFGSFDAYIWQFVNGSPKQNTYTQSSQIPASSKESDVMSKALKQKGFSFVGTTICYAYMQAAGMINDHLVSCPRHKAVSKLH